MLCRITGFDVSEFRSAEHFEDGPRKVGPQLGGLQF